ncbi:26992_t:CDS:2, partial [Racocetra persica]
SNQKIPKSLEKVVLLDHDPDNLSPDLNLCSDLGNDEAPGFIIIAVKLASRLSWLS